MVKFLKHQVKEIKQDSIEVVTDQLRLAVVQQPVKARVSGRKDTKNSSRRLVDPQPIVQLKLEDHAGTNNIDHSLGVYFIRATIECLGSRNEGNFMQKQRRLKLFGEDLASEDFGVLKGTTTVTAQFYKGSPYVACGVFDNLSVRYKGDYRLKFDVYELQSFHQGTPKLIHWENATVYLSVFRVLTDAAFDGLEASPMLNEQLKKAGCKIRTRKHKPSNVGFTAKITKPAKTVDHQDSYASNSYFDSPTPYSRSSTPLQYSNSYNSYSSQSLDHFSTPQRHIETFSTPQTHMDTFTTPQTNLDTFSTPLTHTIAQIEEPQQLDLSPLEQDPFVNSLGNYSLQSSKLEFNLPFFDSMESQPRSNTGLLEPFKSDNNNAASSFSYPNMEFNSIDFNSLINSENQYSAPKEEQQFENPFAISDYDFNF